MQDHLSQTFSALADPTRRAMLARLCSGEANVSDLAQPFLGEMSLPAVTKHLKVLEKAGLITKTRNAQWRSCKINGEGLKDAAHVEVGHESGYSAITVHDGNGAGHLRRHLRAGPAAANRVRR